MLPTQGPIRPAYWLRSHYNKRENPFGETLVDPMFDDGAGVFPPGEGPRNPFPAGGKLSPIAEGTDDANYNCTRNAVYSARPPFVHTSSVP